MSPSATERDGSPAVVGDRFLHEREVYGRGCRCLAGVDEVGRGPLAGPVVAAAVVFPRAWIESGLPHLLLHLNDSKRLTRTRREQFFQMLTTEPAVCYGIARVDSLEIDRCNILQATHRAMNEALAQLEPPPEHVLVDGLAVPSMVLPQTALVMGDSRSYSIAAASVLAKVTRDALMREYHAQWPQYGFDAHKGYGTAQHLAAIARHGPCPIHRMSFAPLRPQEQNLL